MELEQGLLCFADLSAHSGVLRSIPSLDHLGVSLCESDGSYNGIMRTEIQERKKSRAIEPTKRQRRRAQ
ncbi:hypothetical protein BGW80DRAFT_1309995, partial [Lactifluus volemus]